ncbi:hypothetical protein EV644_105179 [Kribbella orskensis]|uniref:PKD domain-containing protein n=2 Tax=Kribbellaceae TaxID=2726069 RepID=A0ABY2BLA6_9ACTN|nr:hypothetical protein EV642_104179 [Kribbella sp. VKM Ac-2500]TCO24147.1 hypothetical protein EV644_105179 [Kribbella orskensis]
MTRLPKITSAATVALAAVVVCELLAPNAFAEDSTAAGPDPTPTTTPTVVTTPTREGAQASTTGRVTRRKSAKGGEPAKPKATKSAAAHTPGRAGQPPRRENSPRSTIDELKLNIGICGRMGPDGTIPGPTRCMPYEADPPVAPTPGVVAVRMPQPQDVRWVEILSEYKNVLFPKLNVKVQPAGRTLVNLDTIVYTEDSKVSATTVTLLGFPVVVEATPMSYTWSFGDGATLTTTSPGKPYPAKEITHKYMKRGGVSVAVTTNYAARFNVAGTGWQYVDGTVPITGPATPLLVREAVPVLVDPPR